MLHLAWIPLFSGMTVFTMQTRSPPLNVIPAQAGIHASFNQPSVCGATGRRLRGHDVLLQLPQHLHQAAVEVGERVELRLDLAAHHILPEAAHVAAAVGVENLHGGEHLQDRQKAPVGMLAPDLALPLAADGEHLAVEVANLLAALIVDRVVAAEIDEVALQAIELGRIAFIDDEEREVLRHERPLVGRALQVD
ncbi:MAG TPA: hypothetical protein EYP98_04110, partial [Planctomycetes bacterium]|nr:hypothetical protein [Planctomycetota bacterium]